MPDPLFTTDTGRRRLETEILPAWLPKQRWFGAKAKSIHALRLVRQAPLAEAWLFAAEVTYTDHTAETYLLPLTLGNDRDHAIGGAFPDGRVLIDATHDAGFRAALFRLMAANETRDGLCGEPGSFLKNTFSAEEAPASRVLHAEQSNTSLIYADKLFVKLYRRLVPGINPDAEMTRHLSERCVFEHVPAFGGTITWNDCSLALAVASVPNEGDAWSHARKLVTSKSVRGPHEWSNLIHDATTPSSQGRSHELFELAALLGKRTGELHRALTMDETHADFAPEPLTLQDLEALGTRVLDTFHQVSELLSARQAALSPEDGLLARKVLDQREDIRGLIVTGTEHPRGVKTRIHGDYHLGQVLSTGNDCVILDFEGEPLRPLHERRAKDSPLRDVAGMLRSFHYAASAPTDGDPLDQNTHLWRGMWALLNQGLFRDRWQETVSSEPMLKDLADQGRDLLRVYTLEKALYEVLYELNNRPPWVGIPLQGVLAIVHENSRPAR